MQLKVIRDAKNADVIDGSLYTELRRTHNVLLD